MTKIEQRAKCEEFVKENLAECAAELVEWSDTGLLRDGKVRELASMVAEWAGGIAALQLATRLVEREALLNVMRHDV